MLVPPLRMAEDLFLNNGWINSYLLWLIFPCFFFVCFFLTLLTVKVTVLIKKEDVMQPNAAHALAKVSFFLILQNVK